MDITTALTSASGSVSADGTGSSASASLSREDFMKILLAEMIHQDPMNPVDNQEFLSQLAQLQTLEATNQLTEGIEKLVAMQQLSSAGALIGKTVSGQGAGGVEVSGQVERIIMRGGDISLSVNGTELALSNVQEMWNEN